MSECDSIIEATSEEVFGLWSRYAHDSGYVHKDHPTSKRQWHEQGCGFWREIGKVADRPICVTVIFAIIDGRRIAFVAGCSQLVDHKMVREWINAEKRDADVPVVDAANFHNAFK